MAGLKRFLCASIVMSSMGLSDGFGVKARLSCKSHAIRTSKALSGSDDDELSTEQIRRSLLLQGLMAISSGSLIIVGGAGPSSAAVGTLHEFSDTNAILQGLTTNVADQSQQKSMIEFMILGFGFEVLRQRIKGSIEETWLGFGPEELSIPADFEIPVSSFGQYGGHASICVRYDSTARSALYRIGDPAPGDNIAFLQVGVPSYRISQMTANGGNVLDAYGFVNVVSPSGLPVRGIVGIRPDPMMFVAINCENVKASKAFYEKLGFVEQPYPFARPSNGDGPFEPPQPKNSAYLAPSPNCMGVLLLPSKKRKVSPNAVLESLQIVYTPSAEGKDGDGMMPLVDPSNVKVSFLPDSAFETEERQTK